MSIEVSSTQDPRLDGFGGLGFNSEHLHFSSPSRAVKRSESTGFTFATSVDRSDFGGLDKRADPDRDTAGFVFAKSSSKPDYGGLGESEAASEESGTFTKSRKFAIGDLVKFASAGGIRTGTIRTVRHQAGDTLFADIAHPGGRTSGIFRTVDLASA